MGGEKYSVQWNEDQAVNKEEEVGFDENTLEQLLYLRIRSSSSALKLQGARRPILFATCGAGQAIALPSVIWVQQKTVGTDARCTQKDVDITQMVRKIPPWTEGKKGASMQMRLRRRNGDVHAATKLMHTRRSTKDSPQDRQKSGRRLTQGMFGPRR
jgi:hypothetical protein